MGQINRLPVIKEELCKAVNKRHQYWPFKQMFIHSETRVLHYGKCTWCGRIVVMDDVDFKLYIKELYGE